MIGIKGWDELPTDCEYCPLWDWEQSMCNVFDLAPTRNDTDTDIENCPLVQIKEEK